MPSTTRPDTAAATIPPLSTPQWYPGRAGPNRAMRGRCQLAVSCESLCEQALAFFRTAPAVLLHAPKQRSELLVAFPLGVLCVLIQSPYVLETKVCHRHEVVILVLRTALGPLDLGAHESSGSGYMSSVPTIGRRHTRCREVSARPGRGTRTNLENRRSLVARRGKEVFQCSRVPKRSAASPSTISTRPDA